MSKKPTNKTKSFTKKSTSSKKPRLSSNTSSNHNSKYDKEDYEQKIKDLNREIKAQRAEINRYKSNSSSKNANLQKEKQMRLNANKDRYWLRQKLTKMQMAIQARLKALGIDFSNINDLGEALDAAFSAIQKLSAALAEKEEELENWQSKYDKLENENAKLKSKLSKYENQIQKQKRIIDDQKDELEDRDRKLKMFDKDKQNLSEEHKKCDKQIDDLKQKLRDTKDKLANQFDKFSDTKQSLEDQLKKKDKELAKMSNRAKEAEDRNVILEEQLQNLQKKWDDMQKENEKLLDELEKTREEFEKANQENANRISELETDLEDQKKINQELQDRISDVNKQLQDALDMIAKLKEQLAKALEDARKKEEEDKKKIRELQKENEKMDNANKELSTKLSNLQSNYDNAQSQISKLQDELEKEKKAAAKAAQEAADRIAQLENDLKKEKRENENLKGQIDDLKEKVEELEDTMAIQDEEIANYKLKSEETGDKNLMLSKTMSEKNNLYEDQISKMKTNKEKMQDELKKLREANRSQEDEIDKLKKLLDEANKKYDDHMNRPRDDKQVQTDIVGTWFDDNNLKLADLDRLREENNELANDLSNVDHKIRNLIEENAQLVDEIDYLLKQAAKFRPDSSNHSGQVLAMEVSPCKYMCATAATDKSVRLWRIQPDKKKKSEQVQVYAKSNMEGNALSLAFTKDGHYLAAGTAYKNGPDGAILVWDMTKDDGEVEFLFRSRPTERFGRVHCLCFSDDGRYIFTGDTTGSVWAWDTQKKLQLSEIKMHKDIVHDVKVLGSSLFSCSLDQTIAHFDTSLLLKIKLNPEKMHLFKPKKIKAKTLLKNEKYPYWKLCPSDDGKRLVAGARKLWIYDWNGKELKQGPKSFDSDLDHVHSVMTRRSMICICRKNTPRAKIFDINSGKETKKQGYKQPVSLIGFVFDLNHVICCRQKWKKNDTTPPQMGLWILKKKN